MTDTILIDPRGTNIYLLAILCPPLAVLLCGKPFQAILVVAHTAYFWFPGVILAFLIVANAKADARNRAPMKNDDRNTKKLIKAICAQNPPAPQIIVVQQPTHPERRPAPPRHAQLVSQSDQNNTLEPVIRVVTWTERIKAATNALAVVKTALIQSKNFLVTSYGNLPERGQPVI